MANEEDPKKAAKACFDSISLDEELYRIGHTKARENSLCDYPYHISYRFFNDMDPKQFLSQTLAQFNHYLVQRMFPECKQPSILIEFKTEYLLEKFSLSCHQIFLALLLFFLSIIRFRMKI
jgi:hypothetical protein